MKRLAVVASIAAFIVTGGFAQDSAKQDLKRAGGETKTAAEDTGKAIKKGATKSTHAAKKGVHKAAGGVEDGAHKVKEKTTT